MATRISYSAAAGNRCGPVKFTYLDSIPTGATSVNRPPLSLRVNTTAYGNVQSAQSQFSAGAKELTLLGTSGELDAHVVQSADGENVIFQHKEDAVKRYPTLKKEHKTLKKTVEGLQDQLEQQRLLMLQWQTATVSVEGLFQKCWVEVSESDKSTLARQGIYEVHDLRKASQAFARSKTPQAALANQIWKSVMTPKNQVILRKLSTAKAGLGIARAHHAHPVVTISDYWAFVKSIFMPCEYDLQFKDVLEAIATMQVYGDDGLEALFVDM